MGRSPFNTNIEFSSRNAMVVASTVGILPLALSACNLTSQPNAAWENKTPIAPVKLATPTAEQSLNMVPYMDTIYKSRDQRSQDDINIVNGTVPGMDLLYANSPGIKQIRAIPNLTQRYLAAIGFLNVGDINNPAYIGSDRYNNAGQIKRWGNTFYTCNIYGVDLLRILLNDEANNIWAFGSRFNNINGKPDLMWLERWNSLSQGDRNKYNAAYTAFDANNTSYWMRRFGSTYGWIQINSQEELTAKLKEGYVAVGASSEAYQERWKRENPGQQFTGHFFVVASLDGKGFGLSQSTNNYLLQGYPDHSSAEKVNPGPNSPYGYWVHKLP